MLKAIRSWLPLLKLRFKQLSKESLAWDEKYSTKNLHSCRVSVSLTSTYRIQRWLHPHQPDFLFTLTRAQLV
jgi:hypothetical protein